jgi:ATP-dependent Clp protease adaptor protein ClpS
VAEREALFEGDGDVLEKREERLKEPELYRVVLHNDHYTSRDFVVGVIMGVFHKSASEATRIMLDVHRRGRGTVGVYVYDIAQTRAQQVRKLAADNDFPLKCTVEMA